MQQLRDIVRAKVDDMRSAGYLQHHSRIEAVDALASTAAAARTPIGDADTQRGPIHLCPWHTCQATRHG